MADNRLYIVNTHTKEYVVLAICSVDCDWALLGESNKNLVRLFEGKTDALKHDSGLIIGTELDDMFYDEHIKNGICICS